MSCTNQVCVHRHISTAASADHIPRGSQFPLTWFSLLFLSLSLKGAKTLIRLVHNNMQHRNHALYYPNSQRGVC